MKVWEPHEIRSLIQGNDRAVSRAVVALYRRQTEIEKASAATKESNGIGFNSFDARHLTYCAKWALRNNKHLSGDHLAKARKAVMKYAGQLTDIANKVLEGPPQSPEYEQW